MHADDNQRDWEAELAGLLGDLSSVQDELFAVLSDKREAMVAGTPDDLAAFQEREETLCQRLQQFHDRRAELLTAAAEDGLPSDSLGDLATALPQGSRNKMGKDVKQANSKMRLLQHQSLTNWVLAQQALLHVSQLMEIIATRGQMRPTYGNAQTGHTSGALVDQQA